MIYDIARRKLNYGEFEEGKKIQENFDKGRIAREDYPFNFYER